MRNTFLNPEVRRYMNIIGFEKDFKKGQGAYLYCDEDERFLDCSSQYGCLPFGYNDPDITAFIEAFFRDQFPTFAQPFQLPYPEELASKLLGLSDGMQDGHCVFTNSGAESVEVAVKLARRRTGRRRIVSTFNSFHGKTAGALACTGNDIYREGFFVDGDVTFVDYDQLDAMAKALARDDVAAVIVEPIQGEGGVIIPDSGYLPALSDLCRRHGTLLIVDEIQTGLMRTGTALAHQGVQPDIVLLAKALGGGVVPLGACLIAAQAWAPEFGRQHSSTFANNNFTCGIGSQVVDKILEPAMGTHVRSQGEFLGRQLRDLATRYPRAIRSVHGRGFMHALHLRDWDDGYYFSTVLSRGGHAAAFACSYLLNRHRLIVLPTLNNRNVIRLQPPLIAGREEIDNLLAGLENLCQLLEQRRYGQVVGRILQARSQTDGAPPAALPSGTSPTTPEGRYLGRFAFFVHPLELRNYKDIFPGIACDDDAFYRWVKRYKHKNLDVEVCHHSGPVINRQGDYVDGVLITSALLPEDMLALNHREKSRLFQNFTSVAEREGATYFGLGAFTSIISDSGRAFRYSDLPFTTGNGLTAHFTSASILDYFHNEHALMNRRSITFVGPCGSIGRLCFLQLAPYFDAVILNGNTLSPTNEADCQALIDELLMQCQGKDDEQWSPAFRNYFRSAQDRSISPFRISKDHARARQELAASDVVVSATSSAASSLTVDRFKPGAAIFDVSRPADVRLSNHADTRGIDYIEAGLCTLNDSFSFGRNNVMNLPPGINLACLAETIVHTMSGQTRNRSLSRKIDAVEARHTYERALEYGFQPHLDKRYRDAMEKNAKPATLGDAAQRNAAEQEQR